MHGGASLAGPASPSFQHGKYSKYLPHRMLARYHEAEADEDLLALRADIALIDTRLVDLLQRVDDGESGQLWRALHRAYATVEAARRGGDVAALHVALDGLSGLIERGYADQGAWSEVMGLIERRRKLVESERKRQIEAQQMIAVADAMALMGILIQSVKEHVTDPVALRAVTESFLRLTGRPAPDGRPRPRGVWNGCNGDRAKLARPDSHPSSTEIFLPKLRTISNRSSPFSSTW